jgi:hypothetical protein
MCCNERFIYIEDGIIFIYIEEGSIYYILFMYWRGCSKGCGKVFDDTRQTGE